MTRCHGCKQAKTCEYCSLCGHWFCDECRPKWLNRASEAFKQLIRGKQDNCCGPIIVPEWKAN